MRFMLRKFQVTKKGDYYLLEVFSRWRVDHLWRSSASFRMTENDLLELNRELVRKLPIERLM